MKLTGGRPNPPRARALALATLCALVFTASTAAAAAPAVSFDQALQLARRHNEQLRAVAQQVRQRQLARDRAWAALLPRLAARGSFTHTDRETSFESGGVKRVFQRRNSFSGELSASLAIFSGSAIPELLRSYKQAAAAAQSARWTTVGLVFEVARAYVAALAAGNLRSAAERSLRTAQENLAAVRARRRAGTALGVDETRARIKTVTARAELIQAKSAERNALDYLALLIGRDGPVSVKATRAPIDAACGPGQRAGDALRTRPDLRAARLEVAAAERAITSAWMSYLPSLTLAAAYSGTQNTGFSGDPDLWSLTLTLDWTLFDGGLRRADRLERRARLGELRLTRRYRERAARHEIRQARRDTRAARAKLAASTQGLALARQQRSNVLTRYKAGLATSLELVEADDALRQAQVALVADELALALRSLELLKASGRDPLGRRIANR